MLCKNLAPYTGHRYINKYNSAKGPSGKGNKLKLSEFYLAIKPP